MRAILVAVLAAVIALTALVAAPGADAKAKKKKKPVPVKVMTRNIFLGADLGPALNADGFEEFIEANGAIEREVDLTDFPRRANALADEIDRKKPHFVGLQEVALWRSGPVAIPPAITGQPPTATTVEYDFLQILLDELSERGARYEAAVVKEEFDFEAPADQNNVDNDAPPGPFNTDPTTNDESPDSLDDAEHNGRLTMRDVILVKDSKKVKYKNPTSGTFQNLYTPEVAGIDVPVTRGWTALDGKVKKGKGKKKRSVKFHFVNSHFEAFDDETQVPSIRAKQAQELVAGPAAQKRTIILGDFNSDTTTEVQPGDAQAYQVLLDAGFSERTIEDAQNSCCIPDLFTGPPSEFDHQVDHVMTNMRNKAKLVGGEVVGRAPVNGIFPSDHAGVFSKLKVKK